jgi:adenylate cyclase
VSAPRILVVDDAPRNVKLLADLLVGSGYEVATAASGADALESIATRAPDLVLLDVMMPGMNGYDVCRAIREDPATRVLPVVMVTALEATEERVKGLEAGADDFLAKPIRPPELLARVRSLLRAKQLYDKTEEQAAQLAEWNRTLEERVTAQVAELERLGELKRFLPPQIALRVVAGSADDPLKSHRREIAAVSVELRGFTAFAETSAPEEVMAVLQELHLAIGRLVVAFEGTVERFTGEGVMIFFNDPVPQPDAAERAVRLALALRDESRALSASWEKRGIELHLGFGVTQGYATLGPIGFETRSDYAAIGTVTSLAARLSEIAEPEEILLSQRIAAAVEGVVGSEPAGERTLRGFLRPVSVVRAIGLRRRDAVANEPAVAVSRDQRREFCREGEYWTIRFDDTSFRLRDSKGLRYIARLLGHPEQEFHALDLVQIGRPESGDPGLASSADEALSAGLGDSGTVLDASAKSAYRQRLDELRTELSEAESFHDDGRAGRLREEIEFLSQQLAAAVGLGGRDRRAGGASERARVNVTRAIADGVKRIREHSPALARHLDSAIRTGTFCVYRPPDSVAIAWRV